MTDRKDGKVPVQFFISKSDRKKLNHIAIDCGKSIQDMAADLLIKFINKKSNK